MGSRWLLKADPPQCSLWTSYYGLGLDLLDLGLFSFDDSIWYAILFTNMAVI